jgi:RsiW-degrading membrane proteinase PrsW (M82 family)
MKNALKTIIGLIIFYLIIPILLGVIIVKAFKDNNGTLLVIIFVSLIVLSIALSIYRFVKYKKVDKNER